APPAKVVSSMPRPSDLDVAAVPRFSPVDHSMSSNRDVPSMIMVPASLSTYDGPPGFRSVEITDIVRGRRPPARAGQPVGRRGTPSRRPLAFGVMSEAAQPATLFLLRHGETAHHAENRYLGSTDEPLNDRG